MDTLPLKLSLLAALAMQLCSGASIEHNTKLPSKREEYDPYLCDLYKALPSNINAWRKVSSNPIKSADSKIEDLSNVLHDYNAPNGQSRRVEVQYWNGDGAMTFNQFMNDGSYDLIGETLIQVEFKHSNERYIVHLGKETEDQWCHLHLNSHMRDWEATIYAL